MVIVERALHRQLPRGGPNTGEHVQFTIHMCGVQTIYDHVWYRVHHNVYISHKSRDDFDFVKLSNSQQEAGVQSPVGCRLSVVTP